MNRIHAYRITGLTILAIIVSCGDSGGGGDDSPGGEVCLQAGMVETGCVCANGEMGNRYCPMVGHGEQMFWTACSCPDATGSCLEGNKYECSPCESGGEKRVRLCMNGVIDCSCPTPGDGDGDGDGDEDGGHGDGDGDTDAGGDSDGG